MNKIEKSKENLKKCLCMKCPSYSMACKMKNMPKLMIDMVGGIDSKEHFEGLFCAFEKSKCIDKKEGCVCGDCLVSKENGLDKQYFCTATEGE